MKRTFFSAALLSAAFFYPAAASADDDDAPGTRVTLYGLIDLGLATQHTSGQGTRNSMISGGQTDSLWGMRGREELDGGWHASFQLETGFNAADGLVEDDSGRLFNYNAWVGLGHASLGEVRLGRQPTIANQFAGDLEQAGWKDMGLGATFKASDTFQFDNTVNYFSPSFGGGCSSASATPSMRTMAAHRDFVPPTIIARTAWACATRKAPCLPSPPGTRCGWARRTSAGRVRARCSWASPTISTS